MGLVLIYMGLAGEEEHEEFDEKMKNIEVEMMSHRSKVFSDDFEDDDDREDMIPSGPENEGVVNTRKERKRGDHKEHGCLWMIVKYICFNEVVKILTTIFCTEMADRSQIAAIALAANYEFWVVAFAGSLGHILALILAILFGKAVSSFTSEK
jgi:putative Ca2+/H+ antiporter (TMEM165/GDT1 family)